MTMMMTLQLVMFQRRRCEAAVSLSTILVWLAAFVVDVGGYFLAMVTEGQVHVLNEGESVVLECSFHADGYSLFSYPVLWRKEQRGEDVQMNIMGNVNEPFASTNRFEVAFTSLAPRYKFELSVLDVSQVDSGNYTCEIRGPYSSILGQSTHYLYVRAPVQSVTIHDKAAADASPIRQLRLVENHLSVIRCLAIGGYPPPAIELYVDRRDVTSDFAYRASTSVSGRRGMRLMTYRSERSASTFKPRAEDDGARLKCIASVQGLKPVVEIVSLDVDYAPKLSCASVGASVGDVNICIKCELHAKPRSTSTMWIVDANGTTLADGHVVDDYWTTSTERLKGLVPLVDSQLCVREVRSETFRKYTIVAENSVAVSHTVVELYEKSLRKVHSLLQPLADSSVGHTPNRTTSRDTSRKTFPAVEPGPGSAAAADGVVRPNRSSSSSSSFLASSSSSPSSRVRLTAVGYPASVIATTFFSLSSPTVAVVLCVISTLILEFRRRPTVVASAAVKFDVTSAVT
jgi:hypothetical protein